MLELYVPNFKRDCLRSIHTTFKQRCETGFYFKGEMHNYWELVYVTEGKVTVSEDNKVYELSEGNIIFHEPMEFHKIWLEKGPYARILVISFSTIDDFYHGLGDGVFTLDLQKRAELEEIYSLIRHNFDINNITVGKKEDNNEISEKITFMKFETFLLSLLSEQTKTGADMHTLSAMNYKRIIDVMTENIDHNLSVEEIAKLCNFSVSNLKKTFNKYAGGGVMKHFMRLKIKKAMDQLEQGYTSTQISNGMGFSSQNYFSKVFKRETGMLPSEFKRNGKEKRMKK